MERRGLRVKAQWIDAVRLIGEIRNHEIQKVIKFKIYLLEDDSMDIEPLNCKQKLLK